MADLRTDFCGFEVKNPIGVTSCDFGGHERLIRRCTEQGIGWIIGKTVHKIDGPQRWPRPNFFSLRRFGCGWCVGHCPKHRSHDPCRHRRDDLGWLRYN